MLKQSLLGYFVVCPYLILGFILYPPLLLSIVGQIVCALLLGAYLYFLNWKQLQILQQTLQFSPSGTHADFFKNQIQQCNIPVTTVTLKYAYTDEGIAMAAGKTVIIDPILWQNLQDDPEAAKVKDIYELHIKPTVSLVKQQRIAAINQALTPAAQLFIFKHELGHVFYNFSTKKFVFIFMTGTVAVYLGIITAIAALQMNSIFAMFAGIFVAACADIFLTLLSNLVWKLHEEKMADRFAVKYSTDEEIEAAAIFFKKHQEIRNLYPEPGNLWELLPSEIRTGHPNGAARAVYLLHMMSQKNKKNH